MTVSPFTAAVPTDITPAQFTQQLDGVLQEEGIGTIPRTLVEDEIIFDMEKAAPPSYRTSIDPLLRIDGSTQAYERTSAFGSAEQPLVTDHADAGRTFPRVGLATEWKKLADVMQMQPDFTPPSGLRGMTLGQMLIRADEFRNEPWTTPEAVEFRNELRTLSEILENRSAGSNKNMLLGSAVILAKLNEARQRDSSRARWILGGLATTLMAEGRYTQAALLYELEVRLLMNDSCHLMTPSASARRRYDSAVSETADAWKKSLQEYDDPRSISLRLFRAMHYTYQDGKVWLLAPLYSKYMYTPEYLMRAAWAVVYDNRAGNSRWVDASSYLAAAGLAYGGIDDKAALATRLNEMSAAAATIAEK